MRRELSWLAVVGLVALLTACPAKGGQGDDDDEKAGPPIAVEAITVARRSIEDRLVAEGSVVALPGQSAAVHPTGAGRILEMRVHVGDRVRAGQPIAVLQQDPAVHADAVKANLALDLARTEANRQTRLYKAGVSPLAQLQQAQNALAAAQADASAKEIAERQARANARPVAPISGIVTAVGGIVGSLVDAGTPLANIADLRQVGVQAEVPASQLGRLQAGMGGMVKGPAGLAQSARIVQVDPAVDPQTQRGKVLARVNNPGDRLKLSMFEQLDLVVGHHQGIAVPAAAVVGRAGRQVVYVIVNSVAHERPVELGAPPADGEAEVRQGLSEGERVATEGAYQLTDGARIKIGVPKAGEDEAASGAPDRSGSAGSKPDADDRGTGASQAGATAGAKPGSAAP